MPRTQAFSVLVKAAAVATYWQSAALAMDQTVVGVRDDPTKCSSQATALKRVIFNNTKTTYAADVEAQAALIPTHDLSFNHEKVTTTDFLTALGTTYTQIHGDGYTLEAVPTGTVFDDVVATGQLATMIASCDAALYQAEGKQETTNWVALVTATVQAWQALTAKPLSIQLSVNPPANRSATPAQVIADTDALLASVSNVAYMKYFYTPSDAGRVQVVQAVYQNYMGGTIVTSDQVGSGSHRAAATHRTIPTHRAAATHRFGLI